MAGGRFEALGGWPTLLERLCAGGDLSPDDAGAALGQVLSGAASAAQIAAYATALRCKGVSADELVGMLREMRAHAEPLVIEGELVDTCGTGGDGHGTINVSTIAALVVAGAGAAVCKHGGRASSSVCGSADVLEALGVTIDLGPVGVARCVAEVGMGFCFAPRFHPAMRHAGAVRRELGVRTFFNFLGPLANPAGATRQVLGVGDPAMAGTLLDVLEANGAVHAMVVFGQDGLDEISITAPSMVLETELRASGERVRRHLEVDPTDLGVSRAALADVQGGDAATSAAHVNAILGGERGPRRDLILVNAAAGLVVAGIARGLREGVAIAAEVIDRGGAAEVLARLIAVSRDASTEEARAPVG